MNAKLEINGFRFEFASVEDGTVLMSVTTVVTDGEVREQYGDMTGEELTYVFRNTAECECCGEPATCQSEDGVWLCDGDYADLLKQSVSDGDYEL